VALTIGQSPAITSADNTTFTVGVAGTFSVTTSGSPAASLTESGTLPGGVTFVYHGNGTGTLSGTPAAGAHGAYSITLTAQNGLRAECDPNDYPHRGSGAFHGVADISDVWGLGEERCERINAGDEYRRGGAAHHEYHARRPQRPPVLAEQQLRQLYCGQHGLHDQRRVHANRGGLDECDVERQRR